MKTAQPHNLIVIAADPLQWWNDGLAKQSIISFVEKEKY